MFFECSSSDIRIPSPRGTTVRDNFNKIKKVNKKRKNTYDLLSFDKKSLHRETFC